MEQIVSVLGALLVLGAYAASQLGLADRRHWAYNAANLIGSAVLTVVAVRASQWGFVLLEGVWAALSVPPLLRAPR
jgi:hypothetical protein